MKMLFYLLIPCVLIYLSVILHRKLVKRSKQSVSRELLLNSQEFRMLCSIAYDDFYNPLTTYGWVRDLKKVLPNDLFSRHTWIAFLNNCSEDDFKKYWVNYEEILKLYINEKNRLRESVLFDLNPEDVQRHQLRLEAFISHKIMEALYLNNQLSLDIENFRFNYYLKNKVVLI